VTGRQPKVRRAGSRWRILVHDWLGRQGIETTGYPYGKAHHVTSDPDFGRLPASMLGKDTRAKVDALRDEHSTTTVLAGTEFDELAIGRCIHLEQMDTGLYHINLGGVVVRIKADRDGRPVTVDVYGPDDYAEPVPGCAYSLTWSESEGKP
jgi:hypothetical protein